MKTNVRTESRTGTQIELKTNPGTGKMSGNVKMRMETKGNTD